MTDPDVPPAAPLEQEPRYEEQRASKLLVLALANLEELHAMNAEQLIAAEAELRGLTLEEGWRWHAQLHVFMRPEKKAPDVPPVPPADATDTDAPAPLALER